MSGNSIGTLFRVTTWGESHGAAIGVVVGGCPPRIPLNEADIQQDLDRRRPQAISTATTRREADRVEILSGVFEGKTTGTPISLIIRNRDVNSDDYEDLRSVYRPGHGDFTYQRKYGIRDHRGGGRASGRETAGRVAAGAIAKKILARKKIRIVAYTRELGGIAARKVLPADMDSNPLRCPDSEAAERMARRIVRARKNGDSLGGVVEIVVSGCPAGLGEPVFDKIDADLAKALMSIGTVKGVEVGVGFAAARMTGSVCNDALGPDGFRTNHAGGILAGITNGSDIFLRVACKPIPSIAGPQETIDEQGNPVTISIRGRHDVSVIPRIIPVCEAMVGIVLADHLLRQRAICT
jgi:chorismate synthase